MDRPVADGRSWGFSSILPPRACTRIMSEPSVASVASRSRRVKQRELAAVTRQALFPTL